MRGGPGWNIAFMAGGRCVMGGPPPKAIWPLGVILRPAILLVRCRGGVEAARARGAVESSLRKGGPGAAARASGAHALRVVHKAFRGAGEPGHSLQAVKNRAAITELAACKTLAIKTPRPSKLDAYRGCLDARKGTRGLRGTRIDARESLPRASGAQSHRLAAQQSYTSPTRRSGRGRHDGDHVRPVRGRLGHGRGAQI